MRWKNTPSGYGSLSIALHWLMLLLIAAVYASMALQGLFPKGSTSREAMATWHSMLGLAVFVRVSLRLAVRLCGPTPAIDPAPPAWQHAVASGMHVALYARSCTCPLRINTAGSPVDHYRIKKFYKKGLS